MAEQSSEDAAGIEPYLLSILSKKFEMASRDMTQSLLRSARSGVINVARDFSSAITLYDGSQFMIDEGLPVHLAGIQYVPEATLEFFDDVNPGDCFLTNSPYAGNSHHADYTLHAPVFYEDEPLFWVISRAHQADIGAPEPSTYLANATDVYQEAPHFPAVRIQEDYEDRDDVVRFCKLNIRAGETQWYGDYRAQISSVRAGEEGIKSICAEYGIETIEAFIDEWLAYGERMMREEIADLPDENLSRTSFHDPIPGAPDGVPVSVEVDIRPDEERIVVDLTGNDLETLPSGFNLTEATTAAAVYGGVFNNLSTDLPHNQGSIDRITVQMNEGTAVGKPEFPAATATATTNLCGVLFNVVQSAFADLGRPHGMAEGASGIPPVAGVVSGEDFRRNDEPFVNQLILRAGGGPAVHGHDGWVHYGLPVSGGVMQRDSVEIDEQKYPILIERSETRTDSGGAGEWRGAPGSVSVYGPREDVLTVAYFSNNIQFPPGGVLGGHQGGNAGASKLTADGEEVDLDAYGVVEIQPGERIVGKQAGGGGYGDPFERDPAAVRRDVAAGIVSRRAAREDYGVVLADGPSGIAVDEEETAAVRETADGTEDRG